MEQVKSISWESQAMNTILVKKRNKKFQGLQGLLLPYPKLKGPYKGSKRFRVAHSCIGLHTKLAFPTVPMQDLVGVGSHGMLPIE